MDVGILGPLRLTVDGDIIDVPPGRQRALLTALAMDAGRVVSADRLVEVVWGERLPANPTNALQGRVSQLRKLVGAGRVVQRGNGYLLDIAAGQVDARRFGQLADRGHELLASERPGDAAAVLQHALELWHGDALEEVADEAWARAEATRLEERRRVAIEDLFDADLARGRHATIIPEVERAVARWPLSERLRGQLMLALYRSGRQADALAVFTRTRRLLHDELGLDPGPELRAIHEAVLRHDERLAAPTETMPDGPRTNLPSPPSSFVGRDNAVDQVRRLSGRSRIVTLTGPGGAGKTRLAIEGALQMVDEHRDGAWLVELSTIRTFPELVASVTDTLGLAGDASLMADAPTGLRRLIDALEARHLLLLLDNCEHVIEHTASFIAELLARCPDVRVLTTSREPLGVRGEVTWSVPSLPAPLTDDPDDIQRSPAVSLLLDRIQEHRPDLDLDTSQLQTVAEITRRLDGLPLALELAAARARAMSLAEIASGLDDRFSLLSSGPRDAPLRQRTLQAVIDWSWELLDDEQRRAWACLAVFSTSFTMDDARQLLRAVDVEPGRSSTIVIELVDRSVLSAAIATTPTRYKMLETIRHYGLARARELGYARRAFDAHTDLVVHQADAFYPTDPKTWTLDLDAATWMGDEAVAVLHRARQEDNPTVVQRLAGSLGWVWWLRGRRDEGLSWLSWALQDGVIEPRAGLTACRLAVDLDEPPDELVEWADQAAARADDPVDRTMATAWGALARIRRGAFREALDRLAAIDTQHDTQEWPAATATLVSAIASAVQGDLETATHGGQQAQAGYAASGAWPGEMFTADMLAAISEILGDHQRARELRQRTLDLARQHGAHEVEAVQLSRLGNLVLIAAEPTEARTLHEAAHAIAERLGIRWLQVDACNGAGTAARRLDDLDTALVHHNRAAAIADDIGHHLGAAMAHLGLGFVAEHRDRPNDAIAHHHQAATRGEASGETSPMLHATVGLAGAVLTSGSPEQAAQLLGAAEKLRAHKAGQPLRPTAATRTGVPLRDSERHDFDRVATAVRNVLEGTFEEHFERGRSKDVGTVVEEVLSTNP